MVEGYHLCVGGGWGAERGIGRRLLDAVPFDEVPPVVERLLRHYLDGRSGPTNRSPPSPAAPTRPAAGRRHPGARQCRPEPAADRSDESGFHRERPTMNYLPHPRVGPVRPRAAGLAQRLPRRLARPRRTAGRAARPRRVARRRPRPSRSRSPGTTRPCRSTSGWRLAEGKPLERRLMAAMAQLDCGACGYVCRTYSEAIARGEERA